MIIWTQNSLLILVLALLSVGALHAQRPFSDDIVVAAFPPNVQAEWTPQPICDDFGACGIFWFGNHNSPDNNKTDILGAVLSPQGQLLVSPRLLTTLNYPTGPLAVGLERGFAVVWDNQFSDGHISPVLQYFDESLTAQGGPITLPFTVSGDFNKPTSYGAFFEIVRTPAGFALFAEAIADPSLVYGVFVFFIDRSGSVLRPRQRLNDSTAVQTVSGTPNPLAVQRNGSLVGVYWRGSSTSNIYVRQLKANGNPLGPEKLASKERTALQGLPGVAASPDGSFLVVWQRAPRPETTSDILARRFSAKGQPLGAPFRVNNVRLLDQRRPVIASDAQGNYFIAWNSFDPTSPNDDWEVHGRLFRHDGKPVSGELRLNQERQFDQLLPRVAFAPNGTVIAGWQSSSNQQIGTEGPVPVIRRFAAAPGQEICAISGVQVFCDLARTGGEAELELSWGGRPGEVTLFGDWDGDGRDDVCAYFDGQFRCDVGHESQAAVSESFGQSGDVPLLADVNGDGRADPCLWRAGQLLCDTAHDGQVHYQQSFAPSSGRPLLGDLDGDRKANLCLVNDGQWECLIGNGKRVQFELGQSGDSFALGDADRDGFADPCLLRDGLLMCNTKHDGGPANYNLQLNVIAGAQLLFGNLDGL